MKGIETYKPPERKGLRRTIEFKQIEEWNYTDGKRWWSTLIHEGRHGGVLHQDHAIKWMLVLLFTSRCNFV
jgi:hypothetical protein